MKKHIIIFLCGLMVVAGTACKNENAPADKTVQKRHLTIKVQGDEGQSAKVSPRHIKNATIDDMGTTLSVEWTAGDAASYCNLSRVNTPGEDLIIGTMTAASSGVKSDLNGDVECTADDYLAIVYPAVDMSTSTYSFGDGVHGKFTISLAGQDGSLDRLASTYHYNYGRAHIVSVNGDNATATMDKMQSLLTVCKFSFQEKTTGDPIPVKTLTISYGGAGSDANKYPQTANVTVSNLTTNDEASAEASDVNAPLTINAGGATEVYVALLPENAARVYNFTVTNGSNTYTGTAEAHLKKGEFVPATGLKLTKQ